MRLLSTLAASAALAALAAPAFAATVTLQSIGANWTNVVLTNGSSNFTVTGSGGDTTVAWGTPGSVSSNPERRRSSYRFEAVDTPATVASSFDLGTFFHDNFTIKLPPSLATVDLMLDIVGTIDGTMFNLMPTFSFRHTETPNSARPCAIPGTTNPCPDLVELVSSQDTSAVVNVGGREYTLIIEGFSQGGDPMSTFVTNENQENSAVLRARIDAPSPVPVPAAGLMALAGLAALGGLGAARRRAA